MTSVISQVTTSSSEKPIDREKICPLLLRIFPANGRHNAMSEYNRGTTPTNELQIYTWMDCSLRELTALIKDVNTDARVRGTNFEFAIVSPDPRTPRFILREIGNTTSGLRGVDDNKTLSSCKYVVGDYIDVAITLPRMQRGGRDRGGPEFGSGYRSRGRDFNGTPGGRRFGRSPDRYRDRD